MIFEISLWFWSIKKFTANGIIKSIKGSEK